MNHHVSPMSGQREALITTPMSRRTLLAGVGITSLAALLAACGSDSSSSGGSALTTGASGPGATTTGATTTDVASTPSSAPAHDTVVIAVSTISAQQTDPHLAMGTGGNRPVAWAIADGLVRREVDGTLVPTLASSWEISADGLEWTFSLVHGVTMHDGSTFTAQDVKTAIDRVKGSEDFVYFARFSSYVTNVEVIDESHVKIVTSKPYPFLAEACPVPIPTAYYTKVGDEAFRASPMSCGAFTFKKKTQDVGLTFERFDGYWDQARTPNFKTLSLEIVSEAASRLAGLQAGQATIAFPLDLSAAGQLSGDLGVQTSEKVALVECQFVDMRFPDEPSPFLDLRVRKAMLHAIDRDGMAQSLFRGFASVPAALQFPFMLGYDDTLTPYEYDPDKARALLAEAGVPNPSIVLHCFAALSAVPDIQRVGELVISSWQAVGVDATIEVEDSATLVGKLVKGEVRGALLNNFPGNDYFEYSTIQSYLGTSGATGTLTDSKVDALIDSIQTTVDEGKRASLTRQLVTLFYDELPALPLVMVDSVIGLDETVVGEWKRTAGNPYAGPYWYLRTL
jgi:peptide/nickel transport system substrate-binding protein